MVTQENLNKVKEAIAEAVYEHPQKVAFIAVTVTAAVFYATRGYYKRKAVK